MMPNVYPGRVARQFDVPYLVSPRGTLSDWAMKSGSSVKALFWPLIQRPSLEAVSCWHATSVEEYKDIRRLGFRQPVAIIPNGVDVPDLLARGRSKFRTLLFLSRLHPKKGLDLLLPAWRTVQDRFRDWELVIVGPDRGGYLAKLQQLAKDLNVQRVQFAGPLYGINKWAAYRGADVFVLPTYSENFGMAVAEALAVGTPAIVSKGAPWEGLVNHEAGWWIDVGLEPLVECLKVALSLKPEQLDAMGQRGRNWMQESFGWTRIAAEMRSVYLWLANKGSQPAVVRCD